jgi:hypothetical protein
LKASKRAERWEMTTSGLTTGEQWADTWVVEKVGKWAGVSVAA